MPVSKSVAEAAKELTGLQKALPTISAVATPLALDYRMNSDKDAVFGWSTIKDMFQGKIGKDRAFNLGFNGLLGALGGKQMQAGHMTEGMGLLALAPAKDLLLNSQELPSQASDLIRNMEVNNKLSRLGLLGGALGAAGLLGLGGYALTKWVKKMNKPESGTIRIKMPGKKNDPETTAEVELPINMPKFSPTLVEGLDKAVRLRARKNIRANSYKKDPATGKLIPYDEWEERYGRHGEYLMQSRGEEKAAASRSWTEGAGSALTTIGSGTLGALTGAALLGGFSPGGQIGVAAPVGAVAGGLLGAFGPQILGATFGKMMGKRTPEEQEKHDHSQGGILDLTIPGYAAYNTARRNEDIKAKAIESKSREAVGDADFNEDSDDMDYDDWDKEASAWSYAMNHFYKKAGQTPQPEQGGDPNAMPPGGAPPEGGAPPPVPGQPSNPVNSNMNQAQPANQTPEGDPGMANDAANRLKGQLDRVALARNRVTYNPTQTHNV